MKLRPVQLVCLALLLATLRLADPAALAPDSFALRAGMLNVLLRSELAVADSEAKPRAQRPAVRQARAPQSLAPAQALALNATQTMRPPAHQSAAVQSHTSFFRA